MPFQYLVGQDTSLQKQRGHFNVKPLPRAIRPLSLTNVPMPLAIGPSARGKAESLINIGLKTAPKRYGDPRSLGFIPPAPTLL